MESNGEDSKILKCNFPYEKEVPGVPYHKYVLNEIGQYPGSKIAMVTYLLHFILMQVLKQNIDSCFSFEVLKLNSFVTILNIYSIKTRQY